MASSAAVASAAHAPYAGASSSLARLPTNPVSAQELGNLQARIARRHEGGLARRPERIHGRAYHFVLIPSELGIGPRFFRILECPMALPSGQSALDLAQVLLLTQRGRESGGPSLRLPTVDELVWALADHRTANGCNAFGLVAADEGSLHWIQAPGKAPAIVALPSGMTVPRERAELRWIID